MKFNARLFFLFLGLLSSAFGDLDFYECGLSDVEIERIDMETCLETPCPLARGHTYTITVHQDPIDTLIDDVSISARALIRGAAFTVFAYAKNPCPGQGACSAARGPETVLEINVSVDSTLLRGLAPLIINATYLRHGVPRSRLCFEFDVNIY